MPEISHITYGQQTRPCKVFNPSGANWVNAIFHLWAQNSSILIGGSHIAYPVAVVEYEDGSIQSVNAETIRFTDSDLYYFGKTNTVELEKQDAKNCEANES